MMRFTMVLFAGCVLGFPSQEGRGLKRPTLQAKLSISGMIGGIHQNFLPQHPQSQRDCGGFLWRGMAGPASMELALANAGL